MPEVILRNVVSRIADAFAQAEEDVRKVVRTLRPNADEAAITNDFERELAKRVKAASSLRQFERAFLNDLRISVPQAPEDALREGAFGLIAEVSWHGQAVEGRTGGDFGLVLSRPYVENKGDRLTIQSGSQSGLLIQAKKKWPNKKWGRFTTNQETLFPSFRRFGGLLLYRFENDTSLAPFRWHVLRRRRLATVTRWLNEDEFPEGYDSVGLIKALGQKQIGTESRTICGDTVVPPRTRTLLIKIGWPDGKPPKAEIVLSTKNVAKPQVHVQIRQG